MKTYITKDFYLCVLLMSKGFVLIDSEQKSNGVYFHIENHDDEFLRRLVDGFINKTVEANLNLIVKNTAVLRRELDRYKK